jgi:hydrogenase maturation protease
VLYPEASVEVREAGERSWIRTECIAVAGENASLDIELRFLQLQNRKACRLTRPVCRAQDVTSDLLECVDVIEAGGKSYETWDEAIERRCSLGGLHLKELSSKPHNAVFEFGSEQLLEPLYGNDQSIAGALVRSRSPIEAAVTISTECAEEGAYKITVTAKNVTPFDSAGSHGRDQTMAYALLSTHTIATLQHGSFISLLDTPPKFQTAAASCRNIGTWPVLAGEEETADCILSSPIILYDYPQVAPESSINMFDGTEIDEMLALRIMTLTDDEKMQMARTDELTRRMLERTGRLSGKELLDLHGALRPAPGKDV